MRTRSLEQLVTRVRSEFLEMPGLRLTLDQSSRLWGLERTECEAVLHALVHRGFLSVGADGKYGRGTDSDARAQRRAAKASPPAGAATATSAGTPTGRRAAERSASH